MRIILIIFLITHFTEMCVGQLMFNNSVPVTIASGTTLTVEGGIHNSGTTSIENSGTIQLTGDWIHDAANNCFGTSQGAVILNGGAQSVGGTNETHFNNLMLTGTGTKTLLRDITAGGDNALPSGILSLNDRLLDLNSNQLTITNPSPLAITRTSGFIVSETPFTPGYGIVKWITGNVTAGNNYIFPFGNATTFDYLPVDVIITAAGTGSSGNITAATYPTVTSANPNNRPLPDGVLHLAGAFTIENAPFTLDRYWIISANNYSVKPAANLNFTYRDSEWDGTSGSTNTLTEPTMLAQQWGTVTWLPQQYGAINPVTNSIFISGHTVFDAIWTLAGSSNPLPVSLLSFDAYDEANRSVNCTWITATEINNDFFTLERSRDMVNFESIGIIDGAGNSTTTLHYQFTDPDPYVGVSYYRLRQTDFDGTHSWSGPIAVRIKPVSGQPTVFPMPAVDAVFIHSGTELSGNEDFRVYESTGRLVMNTLVQKLAVSDDQMIRLSLAGFSNGYYHFEIAGPDTPLIRGRFICQK